MNYKKSILSLAAVLALSTTINADPNATYLPLTNETNDNAWIMFGVNDFSSGIATAPAADGAFTSGFSQVTEASVADDLASPSSTIIAAAAANTMFQDSTGNKNMATFQALKDSSGSPLITESLVMAIKTSDTTFTETQPIRSMYIAIEGAPTVAKIKLNYKATLEGKDIEIQFGGAGVVYKTKISETATFNSPALAADTTAAVVETNQVAPEDVLAYDLTASPVLASAYSKADHQGTSVGAERFYYYDAANAQWLLWDRAKIADGTNTIASFAKGKAYWGRMDINSDSATTSSTKAGLYLGKTGLTEADPTIYTNNLTAGAWNMIAMDPASHPDIRNAITGLRVTTNALANGDAITITDETGVNSVVVTFVTAANYPTIQDRTLFINETIESAKYLGTVPKTFNVKAFGGNALTDIIFLSDKQFTIKDTTGDILAGVKTLAGTDNIINFDGSVAAITDIGTGANQAATAATSSYGEYAMLIEPLVGAGTASDLDNVNVSTGGGSAGGGSIGSASVQFGNIDGDSSVKVLLAADDTLTTVATAQATFVADETFDGTKSTGTVIEIDTNFDGTTDMLLAAADKSFYVKDNTFTRVYTLDTGVDGTGTGAVAFNISPADKTVTPTANDVIADVVGDINNLADVASPNHTEVYAAASGANTLVVISKATKVFELEDADSATVDYFSNASLNADIAKGAVKRIVNIASLVRQDVVTNKITFTFSADAGATETEADLAIDTVVGGVAINPAGLALAAVARTDATIIAMLDTLVSNLNAALKAAKAPAFASHNYVSGLNDITKAVIAIEGIDIDLTNTVLTETTGTTLAATKVEANTNPGTINVDGAVIVSDLKANAVYTPDYVNNGPLYTLKSAGYEAKAIIRASTNLANTPTTHWDHIDLTRSSKDWLKNNEFNLFSIDNSAGYWAYVDAYTAGNAIAEGAIVFTPSFAYHFNTKTGATENLLNAASFSVEITDSTATDGFLNEETSNAKLVIAGNEVQLTKTGTTYSAVLTAPETTGLTPNPGSNIAIALKAADGLGESYTKSDLISFDYDEPAAPTVSFTNGAVMALSDTSTDVASYYIWKDYIPDDGASLTPVASQLLAADAGAYNICAQSDFATTNSYKTIAFDGTGVFGSANASDITGITYVNTIKGATVLTHSNGEATSTVVSYDSSCVANATAAKSGVEIKAVQVGTIVVSYVAIAGTTNNKDDLPYTAFYELADGQTDVLQIDILPVYAGGTFYVEYNGALYSGTFPANQAAADASFSNAINLTAVTSANQSLN